jgi:hypothetical protein
MNGRRAKKGAVREAKEERDKDAMGASTRLFLMDLV